jgi:hypothetical protein
MDTSGQRFAAASHECSSGMVACRDVGVEPRVALEIETLARDKRLSPKDSAFALIPRWQ